MTPKELWQMGDNLFSKRSPLLSLWQEIAENFYPERADFTIKRYLGDEYAGNLMTSYPLLCRRDLQDSIGTMLRDTRKPWFEMEVSGLKKVENDTRAWLQWATDYMRNAMYDPATEFSRACKSADGDFASFGNEVMWCRLNKAQNQLIYRTYHLRDVVWMLDVDGKICAIFRKWKPYARDLANIFKPTAESPKNSVHKNVTKLLEKTPFAEVECVHMMVAADLSSEDPGKGLQRKPWRSIYWDIGNEHMMESVAQWNKEYVISTWARVGHTQYAVSPAVVAALPEARLLQSMTYTLLAAGEKVVNPSMVATEQAVRSDVDLNSGGITWVSYEYDERLGEALRPLTTDAKGMPIGEKMQADCRNILAQCFYLNKLKPFVPTSDPEMTAFQAGQIVAQYIRDALPLFEPMEAEKNGGICNETFDTIYRAGQFGYAGSWPKQLRGAEIKFRFRSPLHDAIDSQKGQKFLEMIQLVGQAMAMDKNAAALPKVTDALRDALDGIQTPAKWINDPATVKKMNDAAQAAQKMQEGLAAVNQGADIAQKLGGTISDMKGAGALPGPGGAAAAPALAA